MKRRSPEVEELLHRLEYGPAQRADVAARAATILRIGEIGDADVLPELAVELYMSTTSAQRAAGTAVDRIIRRTHPARLAEVDWRIRDRAERHSQNVMPAEVGAISNGCVGALCVVCCHRSGFVREAAVRLMAASDDAVVVPFLLIRSVDWVAQVRAVADKALLNRLRPEFLAPFSRCLSLMEQLTQRRRAADGGAIEDVAEWLRRPENDEALRLAIESPHRLDRRAAMRVSQRLTVGQSKPLLMLACQSVDPTIRLLAANQLRRQSEGDALRPVMESMLQDPSAQVRREALFGLAEKTSNPAAALRSAVSDRHASVRETARFYLARIEPADFAECYRSALASPTGDTATALAGLGETGSKEDGRAAAAYLTDPRPRVRRAAARAVGRLAPDRFDDELFAALCDPSAAGAGAAAEALRRRRHLLAIDRLTAAYRRATAGRPAILRLARELTWWDAALIAFSAAAKPVKRLRESGSMLLTRGASQASTVRPTVLQLDRLRAAIAEARGAVDPAVLRSVESTVDAATRFWS